MTYNKNSYSNYGNEYNPDNTYCPKIFVDEKTGAQNETYGSKYGLSDQDSYVTGTTGADKGKWTYYTFKMSTRTMKNQIYVDLFRSSTQVWLASRCVSYGYYIEGDGFGFCMFSVYGGTVDSPDDLYRSYNYSNGHDLAVRPVVEIDLNKVNVGVTGDGNADMPYSIEAK